MAVFCCYTWAQKELQVKLAISEKQVNNERHMVGEPDLFCDSPNHLLSGPLVTKVIQTNYRPVH